MDGTVLIDFGLKKSETLIIESDRNRIQHTKATNVGPAAVLS